MQITVFGAGYVGLVTAACLSSLGHIVKCIDVSKERIAGIQQGKAPFHEPGLNELIRRGLEQKTLILATDSVGALTGSALSVIAVGTPQSGDTVDLGFLTSAVSSIGRELRKHGSYHGVVVKSTVQPQTTDTLVRQVLERESGLTAGQFGLCMNPEFLREGSAVDDFMNPDRIIVGEWDRKSGDVLMQLYANFECPKLRTTLRNAELIKYTSNSLLATLISFSNEIAGICEAMPDSDIETVMDGVHLDRRFATSVGGEAVRPGILHYLRAGCGFGGSCLPKDVNALREFASRIQAQTPLLDAVMNINGRRPDQVVRLLRQTVGRVEGKVVAILGLAFKPGTDDLRDSPAISIAQRLHEAGATICAYDPLISATQVRAGSIHIALRSTVEDVLRGADAAVIATAWPQFRELNWSELVKLMAHRIIIDARNLLSETYFPSDVTYRSVGRGYAVVKDAT